MTGPNRSTAVMQRRCEAPDSLDYFPTPPWATRALCEWLVAQGEPLGALEAWEPCCGEMHMVRPLQEYFADVRASDVHPYGQHPLIDFPLTGRSEAPTDWMICNPPFRLGEAFIRTGLDVARRGAAALVRGAFVEGQDRYATLYRDDPPSDELVFSERVVMLKGRLIRAGAIDPFAEKPGTKASTATAYVWLVWRKDAERGRTLKHWLAPCREALERPGDYPAYPSWEEVHGVTAEAGGLL